MVSVLFPFPPVEEPVHPPSTNPSMPAGGKSIRDMQGQLSCLSGASDRRNPSEICSNAGCSEGANEKPSSERIQDHHVSIGGADVAKLGSDESEHPEDDEFDVMDVVITNCVVVDAEIGIVKVRTY